MSIKAVEFGSADSGGTIAKDASHDYEIRIPRGGILRRLYIVGSASGAFDYSLHQFNVASPATQHVYISGAGVTSVNKVVADLTNPYMAKDKAWLKITNKHASNTAQYFTVVAIIEEPAVSY